ncbi:MAG: glycosyltransferase family 2 protein [Clostridia bacterium]|nr:glycosyltransferase family 2 protein [Clostridia bacterium]
MNSVFIILNYNSYKLTEKLALKVSKMDSINNVVIVDNCSSDNSFEYLLKLKNTKIDVIKSDKNGGYSYGNNFGARYSKKYNPDILFISNPDVDIEESEIKKILKVFNDTEYSILSAVEYDINNNISNPPIWKIMKYTDDLCDCSFILKKLKHTNENLKIELNEEVQAIEMIKGSFFGVRYKDFMEVDGFDENVFLFCEERIIARKMIDNNKSIGIVTDAKYNHNHSASINKSYKLKSSQIKLLYKSRLYYNKKYNNINGFKYYLLYMVMKISILEYYMYDFINFIKYKLKDIKG